MSLIAWDSSAGCDGEAVFSAEAAWDAKDTANNKMNRMCKKRFKFRL